MTRLFLIAVALAKVAFAFSALYGFTLAGWAVGLAVSATAGLLKYLLFPIWRQQRASRS